MLESLLKKPTPTTKLKNVGELEALVAKDRVFLEDLRKHNDEFRR